MIGAIVVGVFALVSAVAIFLTATRRHRRDGGMVTSWADVKDAFSARVIRDARAESAMIAEPLELDNDLKVGDLIDLAEDGSGYVEPRDILTLHRVRH